MTDKTKKYTAEGIQILTPGEAVRLRPGMYIGTAKKAVEHACREFVANAIDQYLVGYGSTICVNFTERGIRVSDDGRGIPVLRDNGSFDDRLFTYIAEHPEIIMHRTFT